MIKGYMKDLKSVLDKIGCSEKVTDWSFKSKLPERGKLKYMNLDILPDGKAAPFFVDEENQTFAYLFTVVRKEKTRWLLEILVELHFPNPEDRFGGGPYLMPGTVPKRIGRLDFLSFQEFSNNKQKATFISARVRTAFERASKLSPNVEKMWSVLTSIRKVKVG